MELAEGRRELGQAEDTVAVVHRLSELLPPLGHEAVAELEEGLAELRAARLHAAVRHDLEHLGRPELRVLGHADGVELYEFGHLFGHLGVFDQSPAAQRQTTEVRAKRHEEW
ncbi:hypothetical protein PanWU01x14_066400, partial [Parasponia andersonii]